MVLQKVVSPLVMIESADPEPAAGHIRLRISACGVCRTDLHVVDGELPNPKLPLVPGHEIVGYVDKLGPGVTAFTEGDRVGVPWLARTCGICRYCLEGQENLCDQPQFTGYTIDGGYASYTIADARFVFRLTTNATDPEAAPFLCAGLIGWRSLRMAGTGNRLGMYGFGAAAHLIAQIAKAQGREVYAFVRPGDSAAKAFALLHGATWAGSSEESPPQPLDAVIIYAPVGALVPIALRAVRKGGRVVCAGIHMSNIPTFPYRLLWEERQILSVANLTRQDGLDFFAALSTLKISSEVTTYPLNLANLALDDLREGRLQGAAVLIPSQSVSSNLSENRPVTP
jgi:propanol-preferring alcohol dehydrogenase